MKPSSYRRLVALFSVGLFLSSCGGGDSGPTDPPAPTVGSVSVSPSPVSLSSLGATSQLTASAASTGGGVVAGTTFTWTSANAAIAAVDANGLVTAVANGTTTVTATASGSTVSGSATVTVAQTAASIAVASPSETVTSGETVQLTATVEDAGGSALAAPDLTWTSSDADLATVSASGLVSALRSGSVTITASQDGADGTSDLTIVRGDFEPTADVVLAGVVEFAALTVPAGVTVTVMDDAVIDAQGPVTITGNVTGECKGLSLNGQSDVTISGTFSNACASPAPGETTPDLVILGAGTVELNGATITSSGDITIGNSLASAAAAAPGAVTSMEPGVVKFVMSTVSHDPMVAPAGIDDLFGGSGGDGADGHDILIRPGDVLELNGSTFQAQHGGPGGSSVLVRTDEPVIVRGGDGGHGGDVQIVDVEIVELSLMSVGPVEVTFNGGDGGAGGTATGTSMWDTDVVDSPNAEATGGAGGTGGNAGGVDSFFDVFTEVDLTGPLNVNPGGGGPGGDSWAFGPEGRMETGTPGLFGTATATGGAGGHSGVAPFGTGISSGQALGGPGGAGTAMAFNGPNGDVLLGGDGFPGGHAFGFGGAGGNGFGGPGAPGGDVILSGGNGGNGADNCPMIFTFDMNGNLRVLEDTELSDQFLFEAGAAGVPLLLTGTNVGEGGGPAFSGGNGGTLGGTPGAGGSDFLFTSTEGPPGELIIGPGANGGNMGRGLSAGVPGLGGPPPTGPFTPVEPAFSDGFESGDVSAWQCSSPAPARIPSELGNTTVEAAVHVPGIITLTGASPFVTVMGPIGEDGSFTAEGTGTVAGTPNIDVSFTGVLDDIAGTLTGEYSMDTGSVIRAGHPIVYRVDLVITGQAQAVPEPENE